MHQILNSGRTPTRPRGQESARAAPPTSPKSALDGLITRGSCDQTMAIYDTGNGQESRYAWRSGPGNGWSRCKAPRLHARAAEVLLIGKMLQTVLTHENMSSVLDAANNPQAVRRSMGTRTDQTGPAGGQGNPGTLRPGRRRSSEDQRLPEWVNRRDADPRRKSGHPLLHLIAGGQPTGRHAPAGNRPAGGSARLVDNHGDLPAAYGNSCEASPILAGTPGAWVTLSHRS